MDECAWFHPIFSLLITQGSGLASLTCPEAPAAKQSWPEWEDSLRCEGKTLPAVSVNQVHRGHQVISRCRRPPQRGEGTRRQTHGGPASAATLTVPPEGTQDVESTGPWPWRATVQIKGVISIGPEACIFLYTETR